MTDPEVLAGVLPAPRDLALFLDIDGTLIGPRHGDREAGLAGARIDLLARLSGATGNGLVLLTGRSIETADILFAPLRLPTAGLQGADRRLPDGRRLMPVITADDRRLFERVAEAALALAPDVEIEWKPAGMALVYDEGDPRVPDLEKVARRTVGDRFRVMRGRVAIDVVPPDADKGRALAAFMDLPVLVARRPVHVGDDVPDEPAFAAADRLGGFGVSVGRRLAGVPHRLDDHEAVWAWLEAYARRHGF